MDELTFWKYHGTGNDFVMIEDLAGERPLEPDVVAALCDRRLGVGADGVIRVARAEGADVDFLMDYRNADGSLAEMCGNGIRCLAKLVYERGHTDRSEITVDTRGGRKHLRLHVRDDVVESVTVGMGRPAFAKRAIPMRGVPSDTFLLEPFEVQGATFKASGVSLGNPHLVLFVEQDPDRFDVARVGPAVEHHELFPEKTNVEFVAIEDGGLKARVWERGVGETMACGTGACAVAITANEAGFVPRRTTVRFPGGTLEVERRADEEVFLTGPAERVFHGTVDPAWLVARVRSIG